MGWTMETLETHDRNYKIILEFFKIDVNLDNIRFNGKTRTRFFGNAFFFSGSCPT